MAFCFYAVPPAKQAADALDVSMPRVTDRIRKLDDTFDPFPNLSSEVSDAHRNSKMPGNCKYGDISTQRSCSPALAVMSSTETPAQVSDQYTVRQAAELI